MFLAEKTVKNYVSNLLAKLGHDAPHAGRRLRRPARRTTGPPTPGSLTTALASRAQRHTRTWSASSATGSATVPYRRWSEHRSPGGTTMSTATIEQARPSRDRRAATVDRRARRRPQAPHDRHRPHRLRRRRHRGVRRRRRAAHLGPQLLQRLRRQRAVVAEHHVPVGRRASTEEGRTDLLAVRRPAARHRRRGRGLRQLHQRPPRRHRRRRDLRRPRRHRRARPRPT